MLKKPMVIHWMGSDILSASEYYIKKKKLPYVFKFIRHWATAPWLVEELKQIGIIADFVPRTAKKRALYLSMKPPALPQDFTVLSYIPDENPEFYGWNNILKLALEFPQIKFNIIRGTGIFARDVPPNICFHGWVDDTLDIYTNSSLMIRITKHDGLSGSVQEPLILGRYVIWSYPFPGVIEAKDYDTARDHVARLFKLHQFGKLGINIEGRKYILQQQNPDKLAADFERKLISIIETKHLTKNNALSNISKTHRRKENE